MLVEWKESCWPRLLGAAMRLLRLPAANRGMLVIHLEEKKALGRLTVEDENGTLLFSLIDALKNRRKAFTLPSFLGDQGLILRDEGGKVIFSYGIRPAVTGQPDQEEPSVNASGDEEAALQTNPVEMHTINEEMEA